MRHILRWVLFGVLAVIALTACASNEKPGAPDQATMVVTPLPNAADGEKVPVEAADSPTRSPQFLNSYADW